jgi:hypothetical protein
MLAAPLRGTIFPLKDADDISQEFGVGLDR